MFDKNSLYAACGKSMSVLLVLLIIRVFDFPVYSLDRIIGGDLVSIQDFPYQLSLRYNNSPTCGAALISEKYALTAAHCIKKQGTYSVRAGSDFVHEGGEIVNVKNAILHPERNAHPFDYDLAILELFPPLSLSDKIQPANLPNDEEELLPGVRGYVSGWGAKSKNEHTLSIQLNAVQVPVVDNQACQLSYNWFQLSPRIFCAGYKEGGKDSCQGDSGGPFVVDNVLYGLVSFGLNCAAPGYPGVYTRIAKYRDYIRLNTGL